MVNRGGLGLRDVDHERPCSPPSRGATLDDGEFENAARGGQREGVVTFLGFVPKEPIGEMLEAAQSHAAGKNRNPEPERPT